MHCVRTLRYSNCMEGLISDHPVGSTGGVTTLIMMCFKLFKSVQDFAKSNSFAVVKKCPSNTYA